MIEITTYTKLNKIIKEFKKGSFDFLILIGEAGIGKTFNTRKILGKNVCYINSHTTVLGLYQQAYENKDVPLWFDDVDGLFEKDKMIGLLKQFCETMPIKIIQYNTSVDIERTREIPKKFETKSKVLMTANSLMRLNNKGVQSLMDRAIVINFNPSYEEMIFYIKSNLKEIYDEKTMNEFLAKNEKFSLREYIKFSQLKKGGII